MKGQWYKPSLYGCGYWGVPSSSAVIPYERLVFACFAVQKVSKAMTLDSSLLLPAELRGEFAKNLDGYNC